jgi:membrane-bound lytic murein transglycosylase D
LIWIRLFLFFVSLSFLFPGLSEAQDVFPTPKGLEAAQKFWLDIFTKHGRDQVVIHDADHLDVVYEVIQLDGRGPSGKASSKRREAAIRRAKNRYRELIDSWRRNSPDPSQLPSPQRRIFLELTRPERRYSLQEARKNIRGQRGLKERFREGLIRSGLYLNRMKEIFRQHGLPEDLIAIAHVESSFQIHALSRYGAAGIWQFTRGTGRRFLTINYAIDERRDPILATEAAAKLLKANFAALGSWPLAVTAYNHGLGGMRKAVRTVGTKNLPTIIRRYKGRIFGFASKNFYAEFLAAREVNNHPEKYFGGIPFASPLKFDVFEIPDYIGVETITQHLGLGQEEIRALNPALRRPILDGRRYLPKNYPLRVPPGSGEEIARAYAAIPSDEKSTSQQRDQWYRVRRGDTLIKIARLFGTPLNALVAINDIRDPDRIRKGAVLAIPSAQGSREQGRPGSYQVQRGDTLSKIARLFGTSVNALMAANNLRNPNHVRRGTVLTIPLTQVSIKQERPQSYRVRRGDTLTEIARLFGTSVKALMAANGLRNPDHVGKGVVLAIPGVEGTMLARLEQEEPKPSPLKSPEKPEKEEIATVQKDIPEEIPTLNKETVPSDGSPTAPPAEGEAPLPSPLAISEVRFPETSREQGWIIVEPAETLGHFADWLEVETQALRRLNRLRRGRAIQVGQRISLAFQKVGVEVFEARRLEYHRGLEEDFFEVYQVEGTQLHALQTGENIWALARGRYGVPFWLVARYNPDKILSRLVTGERVVIPIVGSRAAEPLQAETAVDP